MSCENRVNSDQSMHPNRDDSMNNLQTIRNPQDFIFQTIHNIQLMPLCEGNMMIYSPETGNVTERVIIILLYQILTTATILAAMMSPECNITCEGNTAGKPDRILPCM